MIGRNGTMRWYWLGIISVVASAATHYFHDAKLISIGKVRGDEVCVIDSPLGIFTVQLPRGRTPRIHIGPIRVSVEREAQPGDELRILDENDREYRARIVERKAHPPPPAYM
jgi:hypothetical protein